MRRKVMCILCVLFFIFSLFSCSTLEKQNEKAVENYMRKSKFDCHLDEKTDCIVHNCNDLDIYVMDEIGGYYFILVHGAGYSKVGGTRIGDITVYFPCKYCFIFAYEKGNPNNFVESYDVIEKEIIDKEDAQYLVEQYQYICDYYMKENPYRW